MNPRTKQKNFKPTLNQNLNLTLPKQVCQLLQDLVPGLTAGGVEHCRGHKHPRAPHLVLAPRHLRNEPCALR